MTAILKNPIIGVIILCIATYSLSAQDYYYINQPKTQIEIIDTTFEDQLRQAANIFTTDTINFLKTYFNADSHLEQDEYVSIVHDLHSRKSFEKMNNGLSKLKEDKTTPYWDSTPHKFITTDSTRNINGYECIETLASTEGDTMTYWVAKKLPFIQFAGDLPWGLPGFVMSYETRWHPSGKKNDVRLTFTIEEKQLTKEQLAIIETSKSMLITQATLTTKSISPCDSLPSKQLLEISRNLAAALNEIVIPFQTRYKSPIHQFLETTYIPDGISTYEHFKFGKSHSKFSQRGKVMRFEWPTRSSKEQHIKVKLKKGDQIKSIHSESERYLFSNDTLYKEYRYKDKLVQTDWQYYDHGKQILSYSSPYNSSGRRSKPVNKKFYILHFSADSLVTQRGDGVHAIDFKADTADQCKNHFSYSYDEKQKLESIYNEKQERVEHQFCYYNNGLLKARYSPTKADQQGNGYVYFDYEITQLPDGKTQIVVMEKWPPPMASESSEIYIFDKHNNLIWQEEDFLSNKIISSYHINY